MSNIEPIKRASEVSPVYGAQSLARAEPSYFLGPKSTSPFDDRVLEKPQLAHPDSVKGEHKSFSQIIMQVLQDFEVYKATFFEMLEREINQFNGLARINLEKHITAQKELSEISETNQTCDFIKKTGAMLLGVASIFLGATLLVPGAATLSLVAGGSMIISGTTSILGSFLSETKTHPGLGNALMLTGSVFAILSGLSGAFLTTNLLNGTLGRIVSAFLAFSTGGASAVQNWMKWDLSDIKAFDALLKTFDDLYHARLSGTEQSSRDFERTSGTGLRDIIIAQKGYQASCNKITNQNYI
jgi:hypothetical protein